MAQHVMSVYSHIKHIMLHCVVFASLSLMFCQMTLAQNLPDPTRPPAKMMQTAANPAVVSGPVLQSILIAPNRHVAIISGQTVALNGKYGDQTLIKLTETEAVLRNGKELLTLKLFPDFDKKLSRVHSK